MKMKMPDLGGKVITIKSDQKEAKRCYENSLKTKRGVFMVTTRAPSEEGVALSKIASAKIARQRRPEPAGEVLETEIRGGMFKLGKSLAQVTQDQIVEVIVRHLDAFAWSALDMLGIDLDILCHRLAMDPKVKPVFQRRRKSNEERKVNLREKQESKLERWREGWSTSIARS